MAENKLLLFFILFFVGILGGERHGHHDFFLLQLAIFFAGTNLLFCYIGEDYMLGNKLHPRNFFVISDINFCWNQH